MPVSHRNAVALSGLSAINGVSLASLSAINGQTIAGGGGGASEASTITTDLATLGLGTTAQSLPFTAASGTFVWCALLLQQGGVTPTSCSDGTNTYTILSGTSQGGEDVFIAYKENMAAVTSAVITWTFPADVRYKVVYGKVLNGMATSGVLLDNDFGASVGNVVTGSMTWGATAVIVGACSSTNDRSWSNSDGLTELLDFNIAQGAGSAAAYQSLNVAAGSASYTFVPSSGSNSSAVVAAFAVA